MKPLSFIQSPNKGQKNKSDIIILQSKLRTLYQQLIILVKIKPKSKNQQKTILDKLKAYQSSSEILEVAIQMVLYLIKKEREIIMQNAGQAMSNSGFITEGSLFTPMGTIYTSEQYRNLEDSLQKLELRNKSLIKKQQMTKLYCDDLQQKLRAAQKASQELQGSVKHIIITLKKQNHQFLQDNNRLKKELSQLRGDKYQKSNIFNIRNMQENPEMPMPNLNRIVQENIKGIQKSKRSIKNGSKSIKTLNKLDHIIKLDQNSNEKQDKGSSRNIRSKHQKSSFFSKSLSRGNSVSSSIKVGRDKIE